MRSRLATLKTMKFTKRKVGGKDSSCGFVRGHRREKRIRKRICSKTRENRRDRKIEKG